MKARQPKQKSQAAQCAAAIKMELKVAFCATKFSVRSDIFAGGDAVDIDYTDGVCIEKVINITEKYQCGHFNGMNDIYEYSNKRTDLPQAKYVHAHREISKEIKGILMPFENYTW